MLKLSIIIPVYNGEKYIQDCLNSILYNSSDEYEIIIINDGSTDNTKSILNRYLESNIKVFNNNNRGVSYSRNFGISKALGKWIMFVDADDILQKNWCDIVFDAINKYIKGDIIYFGKKYYQLFDYNSILLNIVGYDNQIKYLSSPFSKLFNRNMLLKNNIVFDNDVINGEDMLFNIYCLSSTNNVIFIDSSFYLYRNNFTSATHVFNNNIFKSDENFQLHLKSVLNCEKFNSLSCMKAIEFSSNNSIIIIANHISNIQNIKIRNKYYHELLGCKKIDTKFINLKHKIIAILLKFHCFNLITHLFNRKSSINSSNEFTLI